LNEAASIEEVKDAYRRLALKYNPNNDGCKTEAKNIAEIPKPTRKLSKAKNKQANNMVSAASLMNLRKR